ncbi:hypothetical protein ACWGRK_01665 [Saccharomonospora azurea]|uniref:Uncharacterized protein n=1 Tax=Saccharomonospora azurea NA-128 TaxID=882081 RepID=H8GDC6_9PSEU|nr:hypothetical protein [Saccharomonospora azurea]EHK85655.1 hypothetical protein SZMC14600_16171 [Saccharomonospora azurea SZMC 14600]EHY89890.1 hypothetical protein SacazDRAFT_03007 [Saccharomonospora azurea NA-128]
MGTDAYLAFIALGLIMIVADGQMLYRSGKRYLSDVDSNGDSVNSMAKLVTVLFHLVMFGFLALLSVLDFSFGGHTVRAVIGNLGVLLLLLALVHAVTMAVMSQMHDARATDELYSRPRQSPDPASGTNIQLQRGPVVTPVPGQQGRDPRLSPTIEDQLN